MSKIVSINKHKNEAKKSQIKMVTPEELPDGSYDVIASGKAMVKKDGVYILMDIYRIADKEIVSEVAVLDRQFRLEQVVPWNSGG